MKKTKIIIGLLFLSVVFCFLESNSKSADKTASADQAVQWETYKNNKYGYIVRYPKGWEIIESKSRMPNQTENLGNTLNDQYGELQRVTLVDHNAYGVSEFLITVLSNPNKLSLERWIKKNYAEQYESGDIQETSDTIVDGQAAKRLSVFGYDSEQIEIAILYKGYIYGIGFTGDNPNDPDVKRHQQIYQQMLSTFKFID